MMIHLGSVITAVIHYYMQKKTGKIPHLAEFDTQFQAENCIWNIGVTPYYSKNITYKVKHQRREV